MWKNDDFSPSGQNRLNRATQAPGFEQHGYADDDDNDDDNDDDHDDDNDDGNDDDNDDECPDPDLDSQDLTLTAQTRPQTLTAKTRP